MFYPLPVAGRCFPRPPGSPLGTWRENSHLVKLQISLTMTPLYHLLDYRLGGACVRGRLALLRKEQRDSNDNAKLSLS